MGGVNEVWGTLRENWRWATAGLLVLFGIYLGVHDLATDRGVIVAFISLTGCGALAYTIAVTQEWTELFEFRDKSAGLGIAFVAALASLFLNHPALDLCRTKAYPILHESAASALLNAAPSLDQYAEGLAMQVAQMCAVAPMSDQANLVANIGEAQTDSMIAGHTKIEPGLVRRLFGWQTPEADGACVADYRALNKVRSDLFAAKEADLVCLDRPKSWLHL